MLIQNKKIIKILVGLSLLVASVNLIYNLNHNKNSPKKKVKKILQSEKGYIFIGGFARSGTTLMRAILDVHSNIKCGPETKIIPPFVEFAKNWRAKYKNLNDDLNNAGINNTIVDSAIVDFISNVMNNRGFKAEHLCAKDPDIVLHMEYIHSILPKTKFIYMVRDGRAAAYSLMTQLKEKINSESFRSLIATWIAFNEHVSHSCSNIGTQFCLIVKYEDLVLHPEKVLRKVMFFVDEQWTDELLRHQDHIGKEIKISKTEWSTHQIIKPINSKSLNLWFDKIQTDGNEFEPLLKYFNYSLSYTNEEADPIVRSNEQLINREKEKYDVLAHHLSDHLANLERN